MRAEHSEFSPSGNNQQQILSLVEPVPVSEESVDVPVMPKLPPFFEPGGEEVYYERLVPLLTYWAETTTEDLDAFWVAPSIPEELKTPAHQVYEEQLAAFRDYQTEESLKRARERNLPPPLLRQNEGVIIDFHETLSEPIIGYDHLLYAVADE